MNTDNNTINTVNKYRHNSSIDNHYALLSAVKNRSKHIKCFKKFLKK